MKIKYAIIAATIIATTTVISVKTFKESTPLFDANVEALAEQETIPIQCAGRSVMFECKAKCMHCMREWRPINWADGPYVLGSASCICGYLM
jgi:hypothetical protein